MAEAAVGKRIKISKMQQHMMLAVLGASLVFGISVVISIFFIKYIVFYTKVIDAKDQSISNYYKALEFVKRLQTENIPIRTLISVSQKISISPKSLEHSDIMFLLA